MLEDHSGLVFHEMIWLAQAREGTFILLEFSVVQKKKCYIDFMTNATAFNQKHSHSFVCIFKLLFTTTLQTFRNLSEDNYYGVQSLSGSFRRILFLM